MTDPIQTKLPNFPSADLILPMMQSKKFSNDRADFLFLPTADIKKRMFSSDKYLIVFALISSQIHNEPYFLGDLTDE